MNKMKSTFFLLASISLVACQAEAEQTAQATDEQTAQEQQTSDSGNYGDNVIQVGAVALDLTDELITELQSQPTINDQFMVLYDNFEPVLDRSDSLTGPDSNNNGIRDDIEAFIDALQIRKQVRKAIKQDARQTQENLYYDFSVKTDENERKALEIANKFERVLACEKYIGMSVDERTETSRTIEALTYNTKQRTIAYLKFNHLLDGSIFTSLPAKEEYCE